MSKPPRFALLVLCLFLPMMVWGQEAGQPITGEAKAAFLQTWSERLQAMQSLHMVFRQEKHLRLLRQPLVAQGELWLKGDTLLYILKNTAGDTELVVRLDPQAVQMHYPLLHTLEVIDLRHTQIPALPLPFLSREPAAFTKEYDVTLAVAAARHTLVLVPRDPKSPLAEIRFTLQDFQPQSFTQVEKNGTRLTMYISTFTLNPDIRAAQLELQIPAGTKVTYPLQ
jgi:outer membrane lipoprotein-sorting protein